VTIEADKLHGTFVDPNRGKITFAAWCEEYLDSSNKRATTLARDRSVTDRHLLPALGRRPLNAISKRDVQQVVNRMKRNLAPATVRTNYGVLRAILSAAVTADRIGRSPCRGVSLPTQERPKIRFLTADDLVRLADATPVECRPMIYLAGVLSLRWSEVVGLRVGRVNFLRETLEVAETTAEVRGVLIERADVKSRASKRTLAIPPFLVALLSEHLARRGLTAETPDALVFIAPEGGPVRAGNFRRRMWAPTVHAAGLDGLTFHGLRHTAVGLMIALDTHFEAIKQRMGHGSIRVTSDVYGSLLPAVDASVTQALEALFRPEAARSRVHGAFTEGDD